METPTFLSAEISKHVLLLLFNTPKVRFQQDRGILLHKSIEETQDKYYYARGF
jgi:hypothetical protein